MSQIISEYISQEHQNLLALFSRYRERKKIGSVEEHNAFQELTNQFQDHVTRDEAAIFPLLQTVTKFPDESDLLKKEHQAICEMVATILRKAGRRNVHRRRRRDIPCFAGESYEKRGVCTRCSGYSSQRAGKKNCNRKC